MQECKSLTTLASMTTLHEQVRSPLAHLVSKCIQLHRYISIHRTCACSDIYEGGETRHRLLGAGELADDGLCELRSGGRAADVPRGGLSLGDDLVDGVGDALGVASQTEVV